MATLKRYILLCAYMGVVGMEGFAQQSAQTPPVPLWPSDRTPLKADSNRVFLSDDRHTIIVVVPDVTGKLDKIIRVPLFNDLRPSVTTSIERQPDGTLRYLFRVANDSKARDAVGAWSIVVPKYISDQKVISPEGRHRWGGSVSHAVIAEQAALEPLPRGRYLAWFEQEETAFVRPGDVLEGFGVETTLKPGFTTGWMSAGKLVQFDQARPSDIFRELEKLESKRWREVYVAAIGPMFGPDTSLAEIRENFRVGMKAWILGGQLQDTSPFVSEVLTFLDNSSPSSTAPPVIAARPSTDAENILATALRLSLQVEIGSARR